MNAQNLCSLHTTKESMARPKILSKSARLNLVIESDTKKKLYKLAFNSGMSISAFIGRLVESQTQETK